MPLAAWFSPQPGRRRSPARKSGRIRAGLEAAAPFVGLGSSVPAGVRAGRCVAGSPQTIRARRTRISRGTITTSRNVAPIVAVTLAPRMIGVRPVPAVAPVLWPTTRAGARHRGGRGAAGAVARGRSTRRGVAARVNGNAGGRSIQGGRASSTTVCSAAGTSSRVRIRPRSAGATLPKRRRKRPCTGGGRLGRRRSCVPSVARNPAALGRPCMDRFINTAPDNTPFGRATRSRPRRAFGRSSGMRRICGRGPGAPMPRPMVTGLWATAPSRAGRRTWTARRPIASARPSLGSTTCATITRGARPRRAEEGRRLSTRMGAWSGRGTAGTATEGCTNTSSSINTHRSTACRMGPSS